MVAHLTLNLSPTMAATSGHSFVQTDLLDNECNSDSGKQRMMGSS
jgi:hypothetical protein